MTASVKAVPTSHIGPNGSLWNCSTGILIMAVTEVDSAPATWKSDHGWAGIVYDELPAQVPPSMMKPDSIFDLVMR
jgi:hypothetical protein